MKTIKNFKEFMINESKKNYDDILHAYIYGHGETDDEDELSDKTINKAVDLIVKFLTKNKNSDFYKDYIEDDIAYYKGEIDWSATLNDLLATDEDFQDKLYNAMTNIIEG